MSGIYMVGTFELFVISLHWTDNVRKICNTLSWYINIYLFAHFVYVVFINITQYYCKGKQLMNIKLTQKTTKTVN